tara:strand:+ start:559 stop:720 length:162 start_codon:yes stop_codon:yes gene_type:complete
MGIIPVGSCSIVKGSTKSALGSGTGEAIDVDVLAVVAVGSFAGGLIGAALAVG